MADSQAAPVADTKKPYQSKVIVVNAILAVLAALAIFVPALSPIHDAIANHPEVVATIWAILNIVLRFVGSNIVLGD